MAMVVYFTMFDLWLFVNSSKRYEIGTLDCFQMVKDISFEQLM